MKTKRKYNKRKYNKKKNNKIKISQNKTKRKYNKQKKIFKTLLDIAEIIDYSDYHLGCKQLDGIFNSLSQESYKLDIIIYKLGDITQKYKPLQIKYPRTFEYLKFKKYNKLVL